jgi:hypothetical protein
VDRLIGIRRKRRDLQPGFRDVTTALLLDGSASLGTGHGRIFRLELACADALCHAMSLARERHGLFVFNGKTRHRVDVTCLKDFKDTHSVAPGDLGLTTGGYTRLGAPLRHLTSRLLEQASERRLLLGSATADLGRSYEVDMPPTRPMRSKRLTTLVSIYYIGVGRTKWILRMCSPAAIHANQAGGRASTSPRTFIELVAA